MVGLRRGVVSLTGHDAFWSSAFEKERQNLAIIFGDTAAAIEHVGSTAVVGLAAKPIIDIEVGLHNFARWTDCISALEQSGYTFMPERVKDDEVFLPKGPENMRTHYLHIAQYESVEWNKTLAFRDALRQDEQIRHEYERLKSRLADEFPNDRSAYSNAKAAFIKDVLESC